MSDVPVAFVDALCRLGFVSAGEGVSGTPLQGGVSSDIWRLRVGDRQVCVKRALARLRVEKEWLASPSRHVSEVLWLRRVALFAPRSVPQVLGHDPSSGIIVMEFLEPEAFPVWKSLLRQGDVCLDAIEAIAGFLVRVHAVTSRDARLAERFDNDLFHQLRLTPYFLSLTDQHPDLGPVLTEIIEGVEQNRKAMTHGDFSPKNILIGPNGPVVLDAECAGWSDPAFDLAFCLNHLLLKSVWIPSAAQGLRQGFKSFSSTYLSGVDWEAPTGLEARAARLLAALLLARIDGKSPVEYIGCAVNQEMVRGFARRLLLTPEANLDAFAAHWFRHLSEHVSRTPSCNA